MCPAAAEMSTSHLEPTSRPLIPGWTATPIPNFSLSAAGLLALADLSTIAQRTALRGGSSWLDSLLLAPGLHYQQAADELSRAEGAVQLTAVEIGIDGTPTSHLIVNRAVVSYVLRTAKEGRTVVLDVGEIPVRSKSWAGRVGARGLGQRGIVYSGRGGRDGAEQGLSWAAQVLYLASPLLTCIAIAFVILLGDWWALALILALMLSRVLNITVIKSRSRPKPAHLPHPFDQAAVAQLPPPRITQYTITLSPTTAVVLRGLSTDLYALTTTVWLRPKTHLEGYLEAMAKMLVYAVASISGNATQAGNLVLLLLLLASAGLLALSNARTTGLRNGGKMVEPSLGEKNGGGGGAYGPGSGIDGGGGLSPAMRNGPGRTVRRETESWPGTSDLGSMSGVDEDLDKARRSPAARRTLPSGDSMEYEVELETRVETVGVPAPRDR